MPKSQKSFEHFFYSCALGQTAFCVDEFQWGFFKAQVLILMFKCVVLHPFC